MIIRNKLPWKMADMKAMLFIFTFDSSYSMIKYRKIKFLTKSNNRSEWPTSKPLVYLFFLFVITTGKTFGKCNNTYHSILFVKLVVRLLIVTLKRCMHLIGPWETIIDCRLKIKKSNYENTLTEQILHQHLDDRNVWN